MYQYRLIDCNKCTTLMQDVDNKKMGRVYRNLLHSVYNFSLKLKSIKKRYELIIEDDQIFKASAM